MRETLETKSTFTSIKTRFIRLYYRVNSTNLYGKGKFAILMFFFKQVTNYYFR